MEYEWNMNRVVAGDHYDLNSASGDALIHCQVSGKREGVTLVFLHGNGEDMHIFDPQIAYFSNDYKVVAIDTRGHGQSTRGTEKFDFHTFALDLFAVLDALHIDKAHIIGFSDGAITALYAATIQPDRLLSMVLLGANYNPRGLKWIPYLYIRLVYVWLSVASLFAKPKRKQREIWGLMVHQPNLTLEEIGRICLPALVVTGQKDMVRQRQSDEISRAIVGAQRLVISGGDHFWLFSQPELLYRSIVDFLRGG